MRARGIISKVPAKSPDIGSANGLISSEYVSALCDY